MLFSSIVKYEEIPRYRKLKCENHFIMKRSDETSHITIAKRVFRLYILLFLIVLITLVGKILACMVLFPEVAFEV